MIADDVYQLWLVSLILQSRISRLLNIETIKEYMKQFLCSHIGYQRLSGTARQFLC